MGKIASILWSMGVLDIDNKKPRLLDNKVYVRCDECKEKILTTADAVYRQHRRGNNKYLCKKCASKRGWSLSKKEEAKNRTFRSWQHPHYAGIITGKALAKQIIKESE